MKFSPLARVSLAAGLILTLGIKAVWARPIRLPDPVLFATQADSLLNSNGFATNRRVHPIGIIVYGKRGPCRMMVAEYDASGTFANLLIILARPIGPVWYAWKGQLRETTPGLRPLTEELVRRQLQRFAYTPDRHPIAAIAASAGCTVNHIKWTRLAALPR